MLDDERHKVDGHHEALLLSSRSKQREGAATRRTVSDVDASERTSASSRSEHDSDKSADAVALMRETRHDRKFSVASSVSQLQLMGLDVTPELVAIAMVYFVQGTLGLSRLALSFFFKDTLHADPAEVALLSGLGTLPWMVKPLYGFLSDSVPLWGYRRRSYLALCGLLGALSWAGLGTVVTSKTATVAAMLLGSLSTAASDVVVDSIVVERARGAPQATAGSLQSLCWASAALGGIASAYFSGSLVQQWGTRPVFLLTAIFPLAITASALLINEAPVGGGSGGGGLAKRHGGSGALAVSDLRSQLLSQAGALWSAIRRRDILLPTVFVFLWQATPSCDSALFYFQTGPLGFKPEFLGRVRLVGAVASLAGVALYNTYLKQVPLKRMLWWAMVLGTLLGSTTLLLVSGANRSLGLSDELFVFGDSVVLSVLGQVSFMPILVLAARLCPEGVEATLFATLMSVLNSGSALGSALGAALTQQLGVTSDDYSNLFLLVALCTVSTLAPAPFLGLLPSKLDSDPPGAGGAAAAEGGAKGGAQGSSGALALDEAERQGGGSSGGHVD